MPNVSESEAREIRAPNLLIWSQTRCHCAIAPFRCIGIFAQASQHLSRSSLRRQGQETCWLRASHDDNSGEGGEGGGGARSCMSAHRSPPESDIIAQAQATARGFEPLRAEPNGFRVHHLNHSVTLSCQRCVQSCINKNYSVSHASHENKLGNRGWGERSIFVHT